MSDLRSLLPSLKRILPLCAILALLFYFLVFQISPLEREPLLIQLGIYALLAMAVNLVTGLAGMLHLGIAGFFALGAYGAGLTAIYATFPRLGEWNFLIGMAVAILVCMVFALLLGLPCLRLRGDYFAIATLAFGEIVRQVLANLTFPPCAMYPDPSFPQGGPRGIAFTEFPEEVWPDLSPPPDPSLPSYDAAYTHIGILAPTVLLIYLFCRNFKRSAFGRALLTIREDEIAAQAMGIHLAYHKTLAFVLSAAIAGIAGAFYFHRSTLSVTPDEFSLLQSVLVLLMVVLGGLGSFSGSIIAAMILRALPEMLRHIHLPSWPWIPESLHMLQLSEYHALGYAILLIVLIRLMPNGIMGLEEVPWGGCKPKEKGSSIGHPFGE